MITDESSIPSKSDAFLKGIDVFYLQFNDVNFYIEDEDQENFYFEIFRKLFADIKFSKIFPLRGKYNVIYNAELNQNDKNKVYIVDKDFDDLLSQKKTFKNLFYLDQYSIENYLILEHSFIEYIIEEKPKSKRSEILKNLNYAKSLDQALELFADITLLHLLVQTYCLKVKNASDPPEKYIKFGDKITLNQEQLENYKKEIQTALSITNNSLLVDTEVKKIQSKFKLFDTYEILIHIPGKYLIKYFKWMIEKEFCIPSRNIDSFNFRLARSNNFENLTFLKDAISFYLEH
ncbi:hypothetical protein LPTSP3_g15210 [Leptospira kobayashii]|uniref:DUF4435 domain-containing protein n=2 Tax=Leptospira kobayashii TaxID=1917830 RepID=A0ABM7UIL0_9LEPT|nr:hypothetical protein LPTSP3_g15210 [Leptospira kobayashii]